MTDTGQVPGDGLPENAGQVEQPGVPASGPYAYLSETAVEEDLLLPGAQGAWGNDVLPPAGPHEQTDTGAYEVNAVNAGDATDMGGVGGYDPNQVAYDTGVYGQASQLGVYEAGAAVTQAEVPVPEELAMQAEAVQATAVQAEVVQAEVVQAEDGHDAAQAPAAVQQDTHPVQGTHETGGRDSGAYDLGAVRPQEPEPTAVGTAVPMPAAAHAPAAAHTQAPSPAPQRRPLHLGPPMPNTSISPVRTLADRGPAGAPMRRPVGPPTLGAEYLDMTPQRTTGWGVPAPVAASVPQVPQVPQVAEISEVPPTSPVHVAAPAAEVVEETVGVPPSGEPVAVGAAQQPVGETGFTPGQAAHEAVLPGNVPTELAEGRPIGEFVPVEGTVPTTPHLAPTPPQPMAVPVDVPGVPDAPDGSDTSAISVAEAVEQEQQPEQPGQQPDLTGFEVPAPDAVHEAQLVHAVQAVEPVPAPDAETVMSEAVPEAQPVVVSVPQPVVVSVPEPQPVPIPMPEAQAVPIPMPGAQAAPEPEAEYPPEPQLPVAEPEFEVPATPEPAPEPAPERASESEPGPVSVLPEPGLEQPAEVPVDAPADPAPASAPVPTPAPVPATPAGPAAPGYASAEREAVLKVMRERRDIRNGFRSDPVPDDVLVRVLDAAHHAPSVGHSQPWDFVVIRSEETRRTVHELAMRQREAYAKSLPKGRAKQFKELKIEAILETPVNIVVTADPTRGGRHTLGRHTQPQMAPYSAALAVENLWLAARAEGLGVGWVSFFDERETVRALGLPEHLEIVAYLCVGYVDEFPGEPELMQAGWSKRRPLSWVVHEETYGRRALPGEEPHDLLAETIAAIRPLDAKALGEAWERQKRMTKPAGALGMLEIISAQLAGLSRQCPPPIPEPAAVAIFAGDHGVHAQGVTPWPQEVTGQMVANILGGGAVSNAFASQVGAEVCVVDVGVAADLPAAPGLLPRKVRPGTADMTTGPAMTREEAKAAIEVGIETARDLVAAGNKALLTGEMGIANTTASAALISVFTETDPAEVTGRGTGINDETLARKTEVVRHALEFHRPDPADPLGVLAAIGGLEHAAMVGLLLGGASLRTPVILDGVSAGAAALVARAIAPEVLAACIAGHRSAEPGHVAALNKLGLRPLVDLDLRLGEGTGALLALPLVQSTARAMHEVATFDSAGVTEK